MWQLHNGDPGTLDQIEAVVLSARALIPLDLRKLHEERVNPGDNILAKNTRESSQKK